MFVGQRLLKLGLIEKLDVNARGKIPCFDYLMIKPPVLPEVIQPGFPLFSLLILSI
jgi:hypothetical protein